jgi:putative spermidine/putrescine transport system substrate-binding protein
MKKGLITLLIIAAAVAVSGCAAPIVPTSSTNDASPSVNKSGGNVEITIAGAGGLIESTFRDTLAKKFEKKTGVKVNYSAGLSSEILSKIELQKSAPTIDIAMFVPSDLDRAESKGLTEGLDKTKIPATGNINPQYVISETAGVPVFGYSIAPAYNTQTFEKNKLPKIESWNDLARPEFKGRTAFTDITNEWGFTTLNNLVTANGGSLDNVEPGLKVAKELARNANTFYKNSTQMAPVVQQGSVDVTVMGSYVLAGLVDAGAPFKMVVPKEGIPLQAVSVSIIKNTLHQKEALEFINYLLSEEAQKDLAEVSFYPVLNGMKVAPKYENMIGIKESDKVYKPDVKKISSIRMDWTERWTREVTPELGKNLKN